MGKRKPSILKIEADEANARLQFKVDADIVDFQGHFAHFPLLPGVTQIDWALFYAAQYLNAPPAFKAMEVIKFQEPIQPDMIVDLELVWDEAKEKLGFTYSSFDGKSNRVHSSGKIKLGQPSGQGSASE